MKHVPRIFIAEKPDSLECVSLPREHYQHVRSVLRMWPGDEIIIFSENIGEWKARLLYIGRDKIIAECYQQIVHPVASQKVGVAFGVIKPNNMHVIIEKCTELGVTDFYPIITDYTNNCSINYAKLQKVAIFAAEQCGRISIPVLHKAQHLMSLLNKDLVFFAALERTKCCIQPKFPKECCFIVGPEGGFSPNEVKMLEEKTTIFTLSHNILRTETAAIACLSIFNFVHM